MIVLGGTPRAKREVCAGAKMLNVEPTKAPFGYAVPGHSWPGMVLVLFKILKKPQLRNDSGQELW